MTPTILNYAVDGLAMCSELFLPAAAQGPVPGLLVFPEAFGLGDHARRKAERLAGLGYAALACDLHGEARLIESMDELMKIIGPLRGDAEAIRRRGRAAMEVLAAQPAVDSGKIAAMGFCFGGTMALELARSGAPLLSAIGFHSGLATTKPADSIAARILVCLGADDPSIPPEQRAAFEQEMKHAAASWDMSLYGGVVHSFTNPAADARGTPDFARYDARADSRSWREACDLLAEVFGD